MAHCLRTRAADIAALEELCTDSLPAETMFLPQNVEPRLPTVEARNCLARVQGHVAHQCRAIAISSLHWWRQCGELSPRLSSPALHRGHLHGLSYTVERYSLLKILVLVQWRYHSIGVGGASQYESLYLLGRLHHKRSEFKHSSPVNLAW